MRPLPFILPLLLLLLTLRAPLPADETTPTLRIIATAPSLVEMAFALGAGDSVVGISDYTEWPPEALSRPSVGDLFNPNLEAMLRLRPTHVLALDSNRKVADFFAPRSGVTLYQLGRVESLAEIRAAIADVARTLGREAAAQDVLAAFDRLPPVPPPPAGGQRPRVLFVLSYGPGLSQLYAVGRGGYLSELLERAGAENVVPAEAGIYPAINKEALLRWNPDVLLLPAKPGEEEFRRTQAMKDWSVLPSLSAIRHGRIATISAPGLMIPGPRVPGLLPAFEKALREAAETGHVPKR